MHPDSARAERIADLRRQIAGLEGRPDPILAGRIIGEPAGTPTPPRNGTREDTRAAPRRLAFGIAEIDAAFSGEGGLAAGALHHLRTAETRGAGAGAGFLAALLARHAGAGSDAVLWVAAREARAEAGGLYAPGLKAFGLDPARLLLVAARGEADALWAIEEGLACRGLAGVVGEFQGLPKHIDLTATRRLALRAREGGRPVFLLTHGGPPMVTAAATRWLVAPGPSPPDPELAEAGFDAPGDPAWSLALEKNRDGRTGRWLIAWSRHDHAFRLAEPPARPVAAAPADRQARPPAPGDGLAHPSLGRAS